MNRWHGGTNFGRWGSAWKTSSYDYDAPMTEYGFENNPKFSHLRQLHFALNDFAEEILASEPVFTSLGQGAVSTTMPIPNYKI
jgi:hypothetical protein